MDIKMLENTILSQLIDGNYRLLRRTPKIIYGSKIQNSTNTSGTVSATGKGTAYIMTPGATRSYIDKVVIDGVNMGAIDSYSLAYQTKYIALDFEQSISISWYRSVVAIVIY